MHNLPKKAISELHNGTFFGFDEDRIAFIEQNIERSFLRFEPDLIAIEGYPFSRHSRATSGLYELGGVVKNMLWNHDAPFVVVTSTAVKKFATGSGAADKDGMLRAARAQWPKCPNHDLADAYHLAVLGDVNYNELVEAA